MAIKKPLVLNSTTNKPEQLQAGDTLADNTNQYQLINGNAGSLVICTPVYISAAGTMDKARANAAGTSNCVGLVMETTVAPSASGYIAFQDIMVATTGQWDVVTGQTGGLTPGSSYFLDEATAGKLKTGTVSVGYVQEIGIAISTTEMLINPSQPIKL